MTSTCPSRAPTSAGTTPHPRPTSQLSPKPQAALVNTIRMSATKPNPFTDAATRGKRSLAAINKWHNSNSPLAGRTVAYQPKKEVTGIKDIALSSPRDLIFSMSGTEPVPAKSRVYHNLESPERESLRPSKYLPHRVINESAKAKVYSSDLGQIIRGAAKPAQEKPFAQSPKRRFEYAKQLYRGFTFQDEQGGIQVTEPESTAKPSLSPRRGYAMEDRLWHSPRPY